MTKKATSKAREHILRPTDVGTETPIENAILELREREWPDEQINSELLLAAVFVFYKALRDAGNRIDTLAPYDDSIRFLIETREAVREAEAQEAKPVDTTWPR